MEDLYSEVEVEKILVTYPNPSSKWACVNKCRQAECIFMQSACSLSLRDQLHLFVHLMWYLQPFITYRSPMHQHLTKNCTRLFFQYSPTQLMFYVVCILLHCGAIFTVWMSAAHPLETNRNPNSPKHMHIGMDLDIKPTGKRVTIYSMS